MPLPSLHPSLPANPTIGQPSYGIIGGRSNAGPPPATAAGGGGVNRETLKGLQDVVWSDDEEDPECIVCAEVLDLQDQRFKPCPCGLPICGFCYKRLKETDGRCPGCRRVYEADKVKHDPIDEEEVKRAILQKARRARIIKQLTSMGRRHLLEVRIVMKNMVYVVGMKIPGTGDEAISILRSHDYFGQYGKISKLYLRERPTSSFPSSPSDDAPGIYIVYVRREDAARAISALDGIPAPQGPAGQTLKASYGTTRYCEAFLRGTKCDVPNCHSLHEWGGENDCFTKDDLETALTRPTEYDARQKQAQLPPPSLTSKAAFPKLSAEETPGASALPNTAGWGKNITVRTTPTRQPANGIRPTKIGNLVPLKNNTAFPLPTPSIVPAPPIREKKKKELSTSMNRARSTDSSQSTNGVSSAAPSPPKKAAPLPVVPVMTIPATDTAKRVPAPPPGLVPPPGLPTPSALDQTASEDAAEDTVEDSASAESEAGPSSTSPAPQTPTRSSESSLPPPFTAEPIFIHSPYEEPQVLSFPESDPGFAFILGFEDGVGKEYSGEYLFQPSPFSKTLVDLAELGVLTPDLPDLLPHPSGPSSFTGSFQPFDLSNSLESELTLAEDPAGPSKARGEDEERPRTTSRFEFARRPSTVATTSRTQSPFAAVRRGFMGGQGDDRDREWGDSSGRPGSTLPPQPQYEEHLSHSQLLQRPQHTGDSRTSALAAQVASFVGTSYGSSLGDGWDNASAGGAQYQSPSRGRGMLQLDGGRQARNMRERDDFDPAIAQYSSQPQRLFSPESAMHEHDRYHPSSSPFPHSHHASQGQVQLQGYDSRIYQQQQQRAVSPSPMGGYRRF